MTTTNEPSTPAPAPQAPNPKGGAFRTILYAILILVLIAGIGIAGYAVYNILTQPLAPTLEVTIATPTVEEEVAPPPTVTPASSSLKPTTEPTRAEATATTAPVAVAEEICGMTGQVAYLIVGDDNNRFEQPYGADLIRLVLVDVDAQKIQAVAIPRNLIITSSTLSKYNVSQTTIGSAFFVVDNAEGNNRDSAVKATNALAQIIYDTFGVVPDHYVTIRQNVLKDVIDTLGGLDINVPSPVSSSTLILNSGMQHLTGSQVNEYVRYLSGGNLSDDWNRFARQQDVLNALIARLGDPTVLAKIPDLYNQFNANIITDLSIEQMSDLACVVNTFGTSKITFSSIDQTMVNAQSDGSLTLKDPAAAKTMLQNIFE